MAVTSVNILYENFMKISALHYIAQTKISQVYDVQGIWCYLVYYSYRVSFTDTIVKKH